MFGRSLQAVCFLRGWLFFLLGVTLLPAGTAAQPTSSNPLLFHVRERSQHLELVVNSSRVLTMKGDIPRAQVNNPDVLKLTPVAANQIQISAIRPGVTQVNLWDAEDKVYTVDVIVLGDARELEMLLRAAFPDAALKIRPMKSSVLIVGHVPRPDMVSKITMIAEDYYPKVISNMSVGGVQTVLLHVKVMEVSRTRLRTLGIDWNYVTGTDFVVSSVSGLITSGASTAGFAGGASDTFRFGITDGTQLFTSLIEALRKDNLVKVLAEPTLVTMSGRPASFLVGGEFPILVPSGIATATVEYKEFGTRVDFVPIVLGNGAIRLEVRPTVSEIDESRNVSVGTFTVPGLRTRTVDTGVEMQAGQTLALAGLIQEKVEAENKGLPWISELPYIGAPFRRVQESVNEIELLIMVTPEIVDAMDSQSVRLRGPGENTTSPGDCELLLKGFLEVPDCCADGTCVKCRSGHHTAPTHNQSAHVHSEGKFPQATGLPTSGETILSSDVRELSDSPTVVRRARRRSDRMQEPADTQMKPSVTAAYQTSPVGVTFTLPVSEQTGSSPDKAKVLNRKSRGGNLDSHVHQPQFFGPVGYEVHP
jgi:pilus assembly protein CpaC